MNGGKDKGAQEGAKPSPKYHREPLNMNDPASKHDSSKFALCFCISGIGI